MNREHGIYPIRFWSLLVVAMFVNIVSQTIHETGHHIVYQLMGRDPVWGFTKVVQLWETPPMHPDAWVVVTSGVGEYGWLKLNSPVASRMEDVVSTAAGPLAGL